MTTAERAAGLASAAGPFAGWLGEISAQQLVDLVATELGDAAALDDFRPRGRGWSRAVAPAIILHVLSGNTPHAALQTLLRGLLLGSRNRCKLPAGGLPEVAALLAELPPPLASLVECSEMLPKEWMEEADAVIVFGGDEAIAQLHARARPDQIFCGHGHRVSLGIVLDDVAGSLPRAVRDASLFDQRGCLSPHNFYVRGDSGAYARSLAAEMAAFNARKRRRSLSAAEAARIQAVREDYRFRAANDERFAIWMSDDGKSTDWTVIHDAANPEFTPSPLDRVIFVKPLPDDPAGALAKVSAQLSAVGYWPPGEAQARWVAERVTGASRVCPLGEMQFPPLTWHQDGFPVLSALVRWVDLETEGSCLPGAPFL